MSNLSEEEIIDNLWDLSHLNTYLDLNNEMKEKCEIPREVLKRWFENSKSLLDLYNKEKEQNKVNINSINDLMKECNEENKRCMELAIELDKEKEKNKELLDKAIVTYFDDEELKGAVANYLGKLLKKNIQKDYISKDKIREALDDGILDAKGWGEEGGADIVAQKILILLEERIDGSK